MKKIEHSGKTIASVFGPRSQNVWPHITEDRLGHGARSRTHSVSDDDGHNISNADPEAPNRRLASVRTLRTSLVTGLTPTLAGRWRRLA